ncbi:MULTISPECIES: PliI family lysozyme inhibitor of I-type lysozyme [Hymenobacter]|uniref:Lysozyme inhibitor of I-type lysozyme n=1 Tax=Hymenobacter mucosus TaxID=1411120 RepID=A0A238VCM1_9BACT|nr:MULTISPECIES: PliI family lysozyme inhibitor of I-type lysozyme [Hymenobacter]SNR32140.1 lysozyme inhibitor of I-type lysozyme [Hymenobacter mucosus]
MIPASFRFPAAATVLLALAACDTTRDTIVTSSPSVALRSAESGQVDTVTSFRRSFTQGPTQYQVRTIGEGSLRLLTVRTLLNGQEIGTLRDTLDGEVQDAALASLSGQTNPELLVFVRSAGSGSYGSVYGYWYAEQGMNRLPALPELPDPAAQGYQGQDTFRIEGKELLRSFPVYRPADANCCPSGGRRTVRYTLPTRARGFQQVPATKTTTRS